MDNNIFSSTFKCKGQQKREIVDESLKVGIHVRCI